MHGAFIVKKVCKTQRTVVSKKTFREAYKKKNLPRNREDPNQKPLTIKPYPMKIRC